MSDVKSVEEVKSAWKVALEKSFTFLLNRAVDAIGLSGAASFVYGAYQMYEPAAWSSGGIGGLVLAWLLGKRMAK